jgi:hypothetical protein
MYIHATLLYDESFTDPKVKREGKHDRRRPAVPRTNLVCLSYIIKSAPSGRKSAKEFNGWKEFASDFHFQIHLLVNFSMRITLNKNRIFSIH